MNYQSLILASLLTVFLAPAMAQDSKPESKPESKPMQNLTFVPVFKEMNRGFAQILQGKSISDAFNGEMLESPKTRMPTQELQNEMTKLKVKALDLLAIVVQIKLLQKGEVAYVLRGVLVNTRHGQKMVFDRVVEAKDKGIPAGVKNADLVGPMLQVKDCFNSFLATCKKSTKLSETAIASSKNELDGQFKRKWERYSKVNPEAFKLIQEKEYDECRVELSDIVFEAKGEDKATLAVVIGDFRILDSGKLTLKIQDFEKN